MRKFLLASHGQFAEGIKHSLTMIVGEQPDVSTLCAYLTEDFDIKGVVQGIMDSLPAEDELIVITDIFGGSVSNEFMKYIDNERIHLVAGLNLPLLIELVTSHSHVPDTTLWLKKILESSKSSIQYCNELVLKKEMLAEESF
jgi:fructoselysine/glucoselysine PTS system EIIA component